MEFLQGQCPCWSAEGLVQGSNCILWQLQYWPCNIGAEILTLAWGNNCNIDPLLLPLAKATWTSKPAALNSYIEHGTSMSTQVNAAAGMHAMQWQKVYKDTDFCRNFPMAPTKVPPTENFVCLWPMLGRGITWHGFLDPSLSEYSVCVAVICR